MKKRLCKHYNAYVRGDDRMGMAFCPDCNTTMPIYEVFNNWLERFRKLVRRLK